MKIVFVSTFADQCGISTYTEELAMAMRRLADPPTVFVLAEKTARETTPRSDIPFERCWTRDAPKETAPAILAAVSRIRPDVVHIQHEFGLFPGDRDFVALVEHLRELVPTVVTMHTVFSDRWEHNVFFDTIHPSLVIVHSERARITIERIVSHDVITMTIPHGTLEYEYVAPPDDGPLTFLSTGFFGKGKGIEASVEAFLRARYDEGCDARYILGGTFDDDVIREVKRRSYRDGGERIVIRDFFHSFKELEELYRSAHVAVLNHASGEKIYSTSGQAHLALAFCRPAIYKPIPLYEDIGMAGWPIEEGLRDTFRYVMRLGRDTVHYGRRLVPSPWSDVAAKTMRLYRERLL